MKTILLFDIGNTHTHLGLADSNRVSRTSMFPLRIGKTMRREAHCFVDRSSESGWSSRVQRGSEGNLQPRGVSSNAECRLPCLD